MLKQVEFTKSKLRCGTLSVAKYVSDKCREIVEVKTMVFQGKPQYRYTVFLDQKDLWTVKSDTEPSPETLLDVFEILTGHKIEFRRGIKTVK